jgi:hypothetical protein
MRMWRKLWLTSLIQILFENHGAPFAGEGPHLLGIESELPTPLESCEWNGFAEER